MSASGRIASVPLKVLTLSPGDSPGLVATSLAAAKCDLAAELTRRGIPNTTTTIVSFTRDSRPDPADDHMQAVMEAGPPVVFINGLGKVNPSPDEVEDVFRRTRSGS